MWIVRSASSPAWTSGMGRTFGTYSAANSCDACLSNRTACGLPPSYAIGTRCALSQRREFALMCSNETASLVVNSSTVQNSGEQSMPSNYLTEWTCLAVDLLLMMLLTVDKLLWLFNDFDIVVVLCRIFSLHVKSFFLFFIIDQSSKASLWRFINFARVLVSQRRFLTYALLLYQ